MQDLYNPANQIRQLITEIIRSRVGVKYSSINLPIEQLGNGVSEFVRKKVISSKGYSAQSSNGNAAIKLG